MKSFNRETELRSALRHLHALVTQDAVGREGERAQEAIDRLAADLGQIYHINLADLEQGDAFGEIEYLRWAVAGCGDLLGFNSDEDMEEAISISDDDKEV